MADVHDVAAYILRVRSPITALKLQKLVYYSQAWSLVWDEAPIFPEPIEAWINGPVVRDLYELYRGEFRVTKDPRGNPDALTQDEKETVDAIMEFYGKMSSQQLSDLTHREDPWKDARRGLAPTDRGFRVISHASMAEYYGSLGKG
jgi:uncharacterized phage-associated protein